MYKFKLTIITTVTVAVMVLSAPVTAKTLVFCSEGSPQGFDPALYTSQTDLDASSLLYDRLVELKPGDTTIQPGLAQSWEMSEDGLEYTFYLRSGVKFQKRDYFEPTRDFNADDVVFTFERQLKPNNPWYQYYPDRTWLYFNGFSMPELIRNIEKVDDFTVKFTLNRAETPFLANLSLDFASIVSKEYAESLEEEGELESFNHEPVGTGPYRFVSYEEDVIVRYRIHPEYWGTKPEIDTIVYVIFPDTADRLEKMKASQCHVMSYPNLENLEEIRTDTNLTLMEQQGLNTVFLAYNTKVSPFDRVEVRKALNMAINKERILSEVFDGTGQVAKLPIPPDMWAYNDELADDEFDVAVAESSLEELGVSNLKMKILVEPNQKHLQSVAELIRSDLEAIGVEVELADYEEKVDLVLLEEDEMMKEEPSGDDSNADTSDGSDSSTDSNPSTEDTADTTEEDSENPDGAKETEISSEDSTNSEEPVEDESDETMSYARPEPVIDESYSAVIYELKDHNGDPDNVLAVHLGCEGIGGFNKAQWCDEAYDKLVLEAKSISDQEERTSLYMQAQEVFKDQAPWATLVHSQVFIPVSNQIVDLTVDARGRHGFLGANFFEEEEVVEEEEAETSDESESTTDESADVDATSDQNPEGETSDGTTDSNDTESTTEESADPETIDSQNSDSEISNGDANSEELDSTTNEPTDSEETTDQETNSETSENSETNETTDNIDTDSSNNNDDSDNSNAETSTPNSESDGDSDATNDATENDSTEPAATELNKNNEESDN